MTRTLPTALIATVTAVVALLASGVAATALQGSAPASTDDLIASLAKIESQIDTLPPEDVSVNADQTWAQINGDFVGANVTLDTVADQARALFIQASDVGGDVGGAVADAARSLLVLRQGYSLLSEWEAGDLELPIGQPTGDDASVYADEMRGKAESGLELVLDAFSRRVEAFQVLRDAAVTDVQRTLFDNRYQQATTFEQQVRPQLHEALSETSVDVLRPISRFQTNAPGTESRAQVMKIVCVARDPYVKGELGSLDDPAQLAQLEAQPSADCPALDNDNDVRLVGQQ